MPGAAGVARYGAGSLQKCASIAFGASYEPPALGTGASSSLELPESFSPVAGPNSPRLSPTQSPAHRAPLKHYRASTEKLDTTFTRSRSSSTSSLENVSSEAIQSLAFFEAFARKGDIHTSPTLWVGTSLGSVLVVVLSFPLTAEQRATQPICISPSGTIFRLKGRIVSIMLLDQNGTFIQQPSLSWKEQPSNLRDGESRLPASNVPSGDEGECQFTVVVSDKQIRVVSLPSHSVLYQTGVTDNSSVLRAARTSIDGQEALVCFVATGHLAVFSLPSLRVVYNVDFLSANSKSFARIENTFTIGNYGLGLYMASPNEIQRFSLGAAYSSNLSEMLAECHVTQEMPEAPKESFLKALLTSVGTTKPVDRDELFGETSGKPTRGVVKPGPNLDKAKEKSGGATNEIAKALQATHERGEKLGQLSDVSERLNADSQQFARSARDLLSKQKDKKWYQL
ncbi:unnamed protein product [Notodromas monacha]|uniref:V-SNARE coiled-coil homology domain-containing protein n=1 Tax=Notodromas monacha TaxID=399045 RepID=A0A7R9GDZ0_9CRUS|nr:unnamed protein product [Notodromas monacha]CAG0917478.1 unnamed protein product [Notodromas monacha]